MGAAESGYTRITTYLRGRFRMLQGPDDHAYATISSLPADTGRQDFLAASSLPDAVNKFLCQLDAKMDAILTGMNAATQEQDFPHAMEILAIGAAGLEFTTALPAAPGDWLEVIVTFRQAGALTAAGIGTITARRVEEDGTPVFSFSFTRIMEEEREKIIRYVFGEERRQLRETRLDQY